MITVKPRRVILILTGNIITLLIGLFVASYFFHEAKFSRREWLVLSSFTFIWFLLENWRKLTYGTIDVKLKQRLTNHFKVYSVFIILVVLFYLYSPIPVFHRGRVIGAIFTIAILDVAANYFKVVVFKFVHDLHTTSKYVLIAGIGRTAQHAEEELASEKSAGYQLRGFINCRKDEESAIAADRVLGDLSNINNFIEANPVDEIVIALPTEYKQEIQNVLSVADYHGIRTKYILDYSDIFGDKYKITKMGHINAVNIRQLPLDDKFAQIVKTIFDKFFAAIVIILLSPLFLLLALLIKLESKGPVFYCPVRIGRSGKPFKVFKFRSMSCNDDSTKGTLSTTKDDPRITKLGRILRKYSLDELPQFFNVIIGNMTVVGPRPHRRFLDRHLQETVYKYMIRHYVKPGITGWAQVNGWRGPSETVEQKMQRTKHDLYYIENWSFWFDVKIIFLTVFSSKARTAAF